MVQAAEEVDVNRAIKRHVARSLDQSFSPYGEVRNALVVVGNKVSVLFYFIFLFLWRRKARFICALNGTP